MGSRRARRAGRGFPLPSDLARPGADAASSADAARWRAIFDGSSIGGLAVYAPDGTLQFTNARMQAMFRVTDEQQEQLEGNYNLLQDERNVTPATHALLVRAFAGEPVDLPVTHYVVRPEDDREPYSVWMRGSVRPVFDAEGEVAEVIVCLLDVSDIESARIDVEAERQRAERQLREIEHLYDTSPIGLCMLDRELCFVRINDRMAEINGATKADHLGKTLREVLPALADRIEPLYRRVLATGCPLLDREVVGSTPADPGVQRHWLVSYHPLHGVDGRIEGVGTVVQDITRIKQVQNALRESEAHLRMVIQHAPPCCGRSTRTARSRSRRDAVSSSWDWTAGRWLDALSSTSTLTIRTSWKLHDARWPARPCSC